MKIAICDDEKVEHNIMHELFSNYPQSLAELQIVDFYNGQELLQCEE